jgi:hypothetical protein
MIRMLIVGYCRGIRSERRLCEDVHLKAAVHTPLHLSWLFVDSAFGHRGSVCGWIATVYPDCGPSGRLSPDYGDPDDNTHSPSRSSLNDRRKIVEL